MSAEKLLEKYKLIDHHYDVENGIEIDAANIVNAALLVLYK